MSFRRIWALFIQEMFLARRSLELIMDLVFFSIFSALVFGYVSLFLAGTNSKDVAYYFLIGMLLWEVVRLTQYSVSISTLWNIWSHNLSNLFITPLSITEFLAAQIFSSIIKSSFMLLVLSLLSIWAFHFNILTIGWGNIVVDYVNLLIFGWSTGFLVLGAIFRYGTSIQALSWGLIFLFQPLTAAFFPLTVLPPIVQDIAKLFPPTYVFEAARANLHTSAIDWHAAGLAFGLNIFYLIICLWAFSLFFNHSRRSGQFARNED
jgi:ABC-2 type transport system permease protein